ncbi:MAG: hypothetical protein E4H33_03190 [Anaerolineales bacterium]|nr:MAG: hypothetical protein E4H33_03190 [Anaerolineales bacterium]
MDIKKFQLVTRTELIRESGDVFDKLLRGRAALIEKHSKPQAVLLDIYDFYGLRAAAAFEIKKFDITPGDLDQVVDNCEDEAETYLQVIGYYLAGEIGVSRAADLLDVPEEELSARFQRLEIPIREEEGDG